MQSDSGNLPKHKKKRRRKDNDFQVQEVKVTTENKFICAHQKYTDYEKDAKQSERTI